MQCPFLHANGRRCTGEVRRARAYGRGRRDALRERDIRKIRLWCSEKDDHAGAVSSYATKNRMEFYPEESARLGLYEAAIALHENVVPDPRRPADTEEAPAKARPKRAPRSRGNVRSHSSSSHFERWCGERRSRWLAR